MGYDAEWGVLGAVDLGAPHQRERIWIVANANRVGMEERLRENRQQGFVEISQSRMETERSGKNVAYSRCLNGNWWANKRNASGHKTPQWSKKGNHAERCREVGDSDRLRELQQEGSERDERGWPGDAGWWPAEPDVGRVAHGVARRVDRLKAIGNGQVSVVAAAAFLHLARRGGWVD